MTSPVLWAVLWTVRGASVAWFPPGRAHLTFGCMLCARGPCVPDTLDAAVSRLLTLEPGAAALSTDAKAAMVEAMEPQLRDTVAQLKEVKGLSEEVVNPAALAGASTSHNGARPTRHAHCYCTATSPLRRVERGGGSRPAACSDGALWRAIA